MKRNIDTLVLTACLLMMAETSATAQVELKLKDFTQPLPTKNLRLQSDNNRYRMAEKSLSLPSTANSGSRKSVLPTKTDGETVEVKIYLDKERPEYEDADLYVWNASSGQLIPHFLFDPSACPVGTYDFVMIAHVKSGGTAFVVKENVEVKNDTSIIFNLSEAKNKISLDVYKRNGSIASPLIYEVTDEGYNIIDEGDDLTIFWSFFRNGVGIVSMAFNQMSTDEEDSDLTFYSNDTSDKYAFTYMGNINDGEMCMFANGTKEITKDLILTNRAEDYVWYEEQFMLSPTFGENEQEGSVEVEQSLFNNGSIAVGATVSGQMSKDGKVGLFVNVPSAETIDDGYMLVLPRIADHMQTIEGTYVGYDEEGNEIVVPFTNEVLSWKIGAPTIVAGDRIEHPVIYDQNLNANNYNEKGERQSALPGHPAFRFSGEQKKQPFGGDCPIIAIAIDNGVMPYQDQNSSNFTDLLFRGRYGDLRDGLFEGLDLTIKLDGEEIVSGIMENWLLGQKTTGISQGVFDVEFVNRNVYVDGLQGQNRMTMQYDAAREDWTPPTLTMLQFRNAADDVTDRFEAAADGIVSFSAADKEFHAELAYGWGYYTINNDVAVEVSYSPFGKNEWEILEGIEEKPEYYYFPEFGSFYTGSLSGVTAESDNGWFDLKIRLTDEAGNWQEQTISPAFHVDELVSTGISETARCEREAVARYGLDGKTITSQRRGLSIVKYNDGTVSKSMAF